MKCYIFDLDGTLADDSHRVPHMARGDWETYFSLCEHDPVIEHVADLMRSVDYPCFIVTGRSESVEEETKRWLHAHRLSCVGLYMRKKGDFRKNSEFKLGVLDELRATGWEPVMAFDDQPDTCKMWRDAGVPCAQVKGADDFVEYKRQA